MKGLFQHFSKTHLRILFGFYAAFVCLSLVLTLPGAINGHGEPLGISLTASLASFSGPFTGAILRHYQSSCWQFSFHIFPFCAAILGAGFAFQFIPYGEGPMA